MDARRAGRRFRLVVRAALSGMVLAGLLYGLAATGGSPKASAGTTGADPLVYVSGAAAGQGRAFALGVTPVRSGGAPHATLRSGGGAVTAEAVNSNATKVIITSDAPFSTVALPPAITTIDVASGAASGVALPTGDDPVGIAPDPTNPSLAYVLIEPSEGSPEILRANVGAVPPTFTPFPLPNGLGNVTFATSIAISPDGKILFVGGSQDNPIAAIAAVSVATSQVSSRAELVGEFTDLAVSPDGTLLFGSASRNGDQTLTAFTLQGNFASQPDVWQAGPQTPNALRITEPTSVTVSPGGGVVFVGGAVDATAGVQSFRSANGAPVAFTTVPINNGANNNDGIPIGGVSLADTPDGRTILVAGENIGPNLQRGDGLVFPLSASTLAVGSPSDLGAGIGVSSPQGIAVTPDQAPVAALGAASGTAGLPVTLNASGSNVQYGSITRYVWTFGDGQSSTTTSPVVSHVYAAAGNYTATVTETDTAGTSVPPAGGTAGRFAVDGPGQTAYRSTNPAAATAAPVGIAPPGTPPPPPPPTTTTTQPSATTSTTQPSKSTPTTSTTTPGQPRNPQLTLSPVVATPGELVTVTGTGFADSSDVTIKWSVSVGSLVVHSDSNGNLPPRQLILLTPDLLGPRFAEAVGTAAKAKLLVVPGTSEPGGDSGRLLFRSEGP